MCDRDAVSSDLSHDEGLQQERLLEEFEYIVDIRALETFVNVMRRHGLAVTLSGPRGTFTSNERLNMKRLKEIGLISSYEIIRVSKNRELVESD
jgi:hypothetical protein